MKNILLIVVLSPLILLAVIVQMIFRKAGWLIILIGLTGCATSQKSSEEGMRLALETPPCTQESCGKLPR